MDNLNVFVSNQPNKQGLLEKIKNFLTVPRIIFVILGIIILVELIYAVKVLVSPVSSRPVAKINVQPSAAKISLNAPKTNLRINEIVPVSVIVDTGGHSIGGVDLIVQFDPKILEATPGGIVKGKNFDEYPLLSADPNKGLILISGIKSLKNAFNGTGPFVVINLKAKMPGRTSLIINFKKGSTTASNLIETATSKNILETVGNLELNVQ